MMDEQQKKYQAMLDALSDEDRLKLRNALEDLDSSLLETSMEDLEGFVKEKYPNAKIVQGNVVQDGKVIGKTTDLYKNDAYDNFIQELYDERFQKSIGIQPDTNILPEGNLTNKTFVDNGVTYSIEDKRLADFAEDLKYGFPEEMKAAEQLADEDFFMKNIQPKIDDYYADLAAREPDIDAVNSYYEKLSQADQGMIDNYYDNLILDSQVIDVADNKVTGKLIKKTIKNRLKKLLIGGLDALDVYELGLIGMALVEPAVQKALQPLMPMIIPGFKGKVDSKTYGQQVIENLQTTAKISPTAKVSETIANIPQPQTQQLTGMGWVGKMLDR